MVCGVTCYNCNWCVVSECFYLISQVVHKYMVMVGAYSWCVVTWCWTNQPAQRREQFIAFCRTLRLRPCSRSLPMATCILYTLTGTVPLKFLLLLLILDKWFIQFWFCWSALPSTDYILISFTFSSSVIHLPTNSYIIHSDRIQFKSLTVSFM